MSYLINHARLKQCSITITQLDLKNAFGEVHHELLRSVLKYHHIPREIEKLIFLLYKDFHIAISANNFTTPLIHVQKGVLQGDCLSPLLFNMCVNTLIKTIDNEKLKCLGYVHDNTITPKHWFQLADDTAIVTALESDNQLLVNVFSKWSQWADLKVRVDKCHVFGMKKEKTEAKQYLPKIIINRERIPPVEMDKSFDYLGKTFSFKMDTKNIQKDIDEELQSYLTKTDQQLLHPLNKVKIVTNFIYSKLKWRFTIYDIKETWVASALDTKVLQYVRKWLQFHPGANTNHLRMRSRILGIGLSLPSDILRSCKVTLRRILRSSKNPEMNKLYNIASSKHVREDEIVESSLIEQKQNARVNLKTICNKTLLKRKEDEIAASFAKLKEQKVVIKHLVANCKKSLIDKWHLMTSRVPKHIYSFCRRALIFSLPNKSNLKRWKMANDNLCTHCQKAQTQLHVLSNCSAALTQGRYTWRHNSVLLTIAHYLAPLVGHAINLFVDIDGYRNPAMCFRTMRPDVVLVDHDNMIVMELTVCFETNSIKSREYKKRRYKELKDDSLIHCNKFEIIFIEITTLGFVTNNIDGLTRFAKKNNNYTRLISKCMESALRASYYIFCMRKDWVTPELFYFY